MSRSAWDGWEGKGHRGKSTPVPLTVQRSAGSRTETDAGPGRPGVKSVSQVTNRELGIQRAAGKKRRRRTPTGADAFASGPTIRRTRRGSPTTSNPIDVPPQSARSARRPKVRRQPTIISSADCSSPDTRFGRPRHRASARNRASHLSLVLDSAMAEFRLRCSREGTILNPPAPRDQSRPIAVTQG